MECRVEDLRYKEVVNIANGHRLGYISDIIMDTESGRVISLVVPGRCKFLGMFWREDDYILPWDCIKRIGNDLVLIEVSGQYRRGRRGSGARLNWEEGKKESSIR